MIHDTVHPVLKEITNTPPENAHPNFISILKSIYNSHADTEELSVFNGKIDNLVLTHMTPAVGAGGIQGIPLIPYLQKWDEARAPGPLRRADFCTALSAGGYIGPAFVGEDLLKISMRSNKVSISAPVEDVHQCHSPQE